MVGVAGFEPAAFWSQTRRADQLRYTPTSPQANSPEGKREYRAKVWCEQIVNDVSKGVKPIFASFQSGRKPSDVPLSAHISP